MLLSATTIFLSAFLLFQVQPMIAKMILPWFGGSASVWITAMLFFQTALLAGYLYAHWSVRTLSPRMQTAVHGSLIVLSLFFLPLAPALSWRPEGSEEPVLRILGLLTVSIGLPYFLLSSTSPLLQAWYSRKNREALPYRLFGLSNLASLAGLLAYPFVVETHATLRQQSLGWSAGFVVFAVLCLAAATTAGRAAPGAGNAGEGTDVPDTGESGPPTLKDRAWWLALAACASTLLLAVTNHLTQNVASIPFLWVLPLGLYLLTFIITFDLEGLYGRRYVAWLLGAALVAMSYGLTHWNSRTPLALIIPVFALGLFIACFFCHGELVRRKPAPRYLTSFYLMLSLGGALGGLLVGVLAPRFLRGYFELPIAMAACSILLLLVLDRRAWRITALAAGAVALVVGYSAWSWVSSYASSVLAMERNFYGSLRVYEYDRGTDDEARALVHGMVNHGMQFTLPERTREHITYYGPGSGVALALASVNRTHARVGIIGLGAGSLAAFARRGDTYRFYDINPLVEGLARREFTYLADCRGTAEVVLGDGRLALEREPAGSFDVLVVDAFSGDAIPVHLLTAEAVELYFRRLRPEGVLALHITNTHLDLEPVLAALAGRLGKWSLVVRNEGDGDRRIYRSSWALLSTRPIASSALLRAGAELRTMTGFRVWTDEYSNLFQILR